MNKKDLRVDIAIIGAGVSGLSCGYFLKKMRIDNFLILDANPKPNTSKGPGFFSREVWDNYTRAHHNHDPAKAKILWNFHSQGFSDLVEYLENQKITYRLGKRVRLLTSEHEVKEATIAVRLLKENGFESELIGNRQESQHSAGLLDASTLADSLSAAISGKIKNYNALSITTGSQVTIATEEHNIRCELCVLACDWEIAKLLPELEEAIIPISDQWNLIENLNDAAAVDPNLYSANHGYYFAVQQNQGAWALGGARFLRHLAGIGVYHYKPDERISKHLKEAFEKIASLRLGRELNSTPMIEASSCDDLPIIGPILGNSRLLLATAYNKTGLSTGFYAGHCLAELIASGRCEKLPEIFSPKRFQGF